MKRFLGIVVLGYLWCTPSYAEFIMQDLINVLIETKKAKSIEVANNLQSIGSDDQTYELVIRNANLSLKNATNIAKAIDKFSKNNGPKLSTLSMSFNPDLRDEGVIAILDKIPKNTPVIAFVECGMTDKAGQAIIDWALENKEINGIYIEGNAFSNSMEAKFEKLRIERPQLTILSKWASEEFKKMVKKNFN